MHRRTFLQRIAALPIIGAAMGKAVKAAPQNVCAAPSAGAEPVGFVGNPDWPRTCMERPLQVGVRGQDYFVAGDNFPYDALCVEGFKGGEDIKNVAFEVDFAAGWVGCFARDWGTNAISICPFTSEPIRYWVKGKINVTASVDCRVDLSSIRDSLDDLRLSIRQLAED
jgi:hypothetical protein